MKSRRLMTNPSSNCRLITSATPSPVTMWYFFPWNTSVQEKSLMNLISVKCRTLLFRYRVKNNPVIGSDMMVFNIISLGVPEWIHHPM